MLAPKENDLANKPLILNDGIVLNNETLTQYDEGTWVPTWGASGGTPAIGNGSITAKYTRIGNVVSASLTVRFGSSTNVAGTTNWTFTLPFTAAAAGVGSVYILDNGTGYFFRQAVVSAGSATFALLPLDGTTSTVGATTPMTWTTDDSLLISMTYLI